MRFVEPIHHRPGSVRDKYSAGGGIRIQFVIAEAVNGRRKRICLLHHAYDDKRLSFDFQHLAHRFNAAKQGGCCLGIDNRNLADTVVIVSQKLSARNDPVSVYLEISVVNAIHRAVKIGILIINGVAVISAVIEGHLLHTLEFLQSLAHTFFDGANAVWDSLISHVIDMVGLIQLHRHYIVARTNQVRLNLLIGAFNGGNNGNNRRNADDNAKHR